MIVLKVVDRAAGRVLASPGVPDLDTLRLGQPEPLREREVPGTDCLAKIQGSSIWAALNWARIGVTQGPHLFPGPELSVVRTAKSGVLSIGIAALERTLQRHAGWVNILVPLVR